jgi:hypothetical protein
VTSAAAIQAQTECYAILHSQPTVTYNNLGHVVLHYENEGPDTLDAGGTQPIFERHGYVINVIQQRVPTPAPPPSCSVGDLDVGILPPGQYFLNWTCDRCYPSIFFTGTTILHTSFVLDPPGRVPALDHFALATLALLLAVTGALTLRSS